MGEPGGIEHEAAGTEGEAAGAATAEAELTAGMGAPATGTRGRLAPGLYLVATPIGNLEDMTLRGLRVLREADRIACEDTRQTQKVLNHFGIRTPTVSYHAHNEAERAAGLLAELQAGGTGGSGERCGVRPGIADPGAVLGAGGDRGGGGGVSRCREQMRRWRPLIASGLGAERFRFHGFLPSKAGERRSVLEALCRMRAAAGWSGEATTEIFYETPHRIVEALARCSGGVWARGSAVVVARELTKLHEEFLRGTAAEVRAVLAGRESVRGEMVLLLAPGAAVAEAHGETQGGGYARRCED